MNAPQPEACEMKSVSALHGGRILRAMKYSWQGLARAWTDEAAFRQELCFFGLLAPATLALRPGRLEAVVLLALMALVLALELLNSGLEALVDKTCPEKHPLAGKAKDCGSAAVLVAMLTLLGAWCALAGPLLWARLA